MIAFGQRLATAMDRCGRLCVGIDPHPQLLQSWGLSVDAAGVGEFGLRVVDALAGQVAAVKPQSAFFERWGAAGIAALEQVLAQARQANLLTILDVKRGDIGSTMAGYAQAYLDPDSPLVADAITLSPYLGFDSLRPAIDLAQAGGRGVFVLALTSNPEGAAVQHAIGPDGQAVAAAIAGRARELNRGATPMGSIGLVVGATVGAAVDRLRLDLESVNGPLLAPGFGAQGATVADLRAVFGAGYRSVLVASSRQVLAAGPDPAALRTVCAQLTDQLA